MQITSEQLRLFLKALINRIVSFRVEGLEHVPAAGGALLVCNHGDLVDGLLVALFSGRRVHFPGRKEVQNSPVFATIDRVFQELRSQLEGENVVLDLGEELLDLTAQLLHDLGRMYPFTGNWLPAPLALDEHHDQLAALLREGELVAVFPGNGFTRGRKPGTFDPAVARLLLETRVPLLPAALYGTYGLSDWGRWVAGRNRGRVVLYRIGSPVPPALLPEASDKSTVRLWSHKMEEKVERLLRTAGKKRMYRRPPSASATPPANAALEAAPVQAELPFE